MLRKLAWLLVFAIFGVIGFDYIKNNVDFESAIDQIKNNVDVDGTIDYVKNNVDIDKTINEVAGFIDSKLQEEQIVVTTEPINSAIVPVDNVQSKKITGAVTTANELADAAYYYLSRYEPQFTIEFSGDTSKLEAIIQEAYTLIEKRDPYVYGHLSDRNIEFTYTARRATLNFQQQYLTTYEQERLVNGKVQAILQTVDTKAMNDVDKVKFVNDYIVQHTVYSESTKASPHSAYAILYEGKGVCQGYALLAYKMLTELGIEALYVTGEVYTGGHAWNLVKLDGNWSHLDTTWNDPLPDRGNGVSYNYFLITDSQMKKDHAWDLSKYPRAAKQVSF